MFSDRIPVLRSNSIAQALQRHREAGCPIDDLTVSNTSCVGLDYPDGLLDPLADPAVRAAVQRAPFELLIGFQLTEDQLRYNATR